MMLDHLPSSDDVNVLDAQTSARLGARLRMARHRRKMTLKTLADLTGCSESLLSKIENGKAFPSLPMLQRLVQSLDTNIGWMFEDRDSKQPVVFRAGDRKAVAVEATRRAISIERVIPDAERHLLACNIYHIEAGAESAGEHQHAGEEAGYLLDGQIELVIDGCVHRLTAGDAFAFRSDQPHSYRNVGHGRASIFWVNTPPLS